MGRNTLGRRVFVTFAAALSVGVLGTASTAQAEPMAFGTHTWSGDVYDGRGGGLAGSASTAEGHEFDVSATLDHRSVEVTIFQSADEMWNLQFVAPKGQVLAEGRYEGAAYPHLGTPEQPGLAVSTPWGSSSDVTGSFVITDLTFGDGQKVESFAVSYVQHREGFEPLTGAIEID